MHPVFKKWLIIFIVALLTCSVLAGAAVGALLGYVNSMDPLTALKDYRPPEVSRVFDRTGNRQIDEFVSERREVVAYKDIPQHVIDAYLAIEDERFYDHFGIDFRGIARAMYTNLQTSGRSQGASTITQQVARNVFLSSERTYVRKIREVLLSLKIERNFSKQQILEFYLNQIFLGSGAYGVQAASRAYFNKDVKDLTVPEGALLAGLPKAPSNYSPLKNAKKALDRRNTVLGNMFKCGYIKTQAELDRYKSMPIELNPAPRPKQEARYFTSFLSTDLTSTDKEGAAELGSLGINVISTADLTLQKICEEELSKGLRETEKEIQRQKEQRFGNEAQELGSVRKGQARLMRITAIRENEITVKLGGYTGAIKLPQKLPYFNPADVVKEGKLIDIVVNELQGSKIVGSLYDKTHVQGAAVLLDVRSGEVLALVGGDDYDDPVNNGQYNRAVQGGRQPGSCWKPLLYSQSFDLMNEAGKPRFTPGSIEVDSPLTIGNWSPKNYEGKFSGDNTLYLALVKSRNIPTVKLFQSIGASKAIELYQKFKVVNPETPWALTPDPPMSLGTPNVTPLELAAAYTAFANGGMAVRPNPVKRVYGGKDPSSNRLEKTALTRVLSAEAAYMTTRILMDVMHRGTAKATVGKWIDEQGSKGRKLPEIAGKTGTTNGCYVAWLSGYTPELALTIYLGYDQHRSMGPKIVGGANVGPIWVAAMDRILQTRTEWKMKFDVPENCVLVDMCGKSGKLATGACMGDSASVFKNVAFKRGSQPTATCGYHGGGRLSDESDEDAEKNYDTGRGASVGEPGDPVQGQFIPYNM